MKLTTYKDTKDNDKVLIIGLPGTGKSTLAAELAKKFHVTWIDTEHGVKTLMKLPQEAQENIDVVVLPDSASYPIAAATIVELFKKGKGLICHEHGKIDCQFCKRDKPTESTLVDFSTFTKNDILVLDTITQVGYSILSHITRTSPVDYKPERDDWGSLRKQTEFLSSQIQALGINFVCIAHVIEAEMEDGKTKLVPAFGSKGMSATFAKAFDHVVYCDIRNGKHVAGSATSYANNILTKSRTDFCIENYPVASLIPLFDGSYHLSQPKKAGVAK